MRVRFSRGVPEMLLLWWRSLADAPGRFSFPPLSHLLMIFSWTIHLSLLICRKEREHIYVKCLAQCLRRLVLLLSGHFSFAALGSYSQIIPLQYELAICNLKIYRFRIFGLRVKGPLPDFLYQFFLSNWKKKRGCLTSFHFRVQFLSSPFCWVMVKVIVKKIFYVRRI